MKYEVSCGAVVFTIKENTIYYVIVKSLDGIYGFPKGHMEKGETELDTAKREIFEEVGIMPTVNTNFRETVEYKVKRNIKKTVVNFVAEYKDQVIKHQEKELQGAYLMTYEEAMSKFQFDNSKKILTLAKAFIEKEYSEEIN